MSRLAIVVPCGRLARSRQRMFCGLSEARTNAVHSSPLRVRVSTRSVRVIRVWPTPVNRVAEEAASTDPAIGRSECSRECGRSHGRDVHDRMLIAQSGSNSAGTAQLCPADAQAAAAARSGTDSDGGRLASVRKCPTHARTAPIEPNARHRASPTLNSVGSWWRTTLEAADLPHFHLHNFRDIHASALLAAGRDDVTVQRALDRSEATTALSRYLTDDRGAGTAPRCCRQHRGSTSTSRYGARRRPFTSEINERSNICHSVPGSDGRAARGTRKSHLLRPKTSLGIHRLPLRLAG